MAHIYVVAAENGTYKIGFANRPRERLTGLRSGSAYRLSLLRTQEVPTRFARLVERTVHDQYRSDRVHGEWFSLPPGLTPKAFAADVCAAARLYALAFAKGARPLWQIPELKRNLRR